MVFLILLIVPVLVLIIKFRDNDYNQACKLWDLFQIFFLFYLNFLRFLINNHLSKCSIFRHFFIKLTKIISIFLNQSIDWTISTNFMSKRILITDEMFLFSESFSTHLIQGQFRRWLSVCTISSPLYLSSFPSNPIDYSH